MDKKQKTIDYCVRMAILASVIKEEDKELLGNLLAVAYSDGKMAGFNEAIDLRHRHESMTEEQLIERAKEDSSTVTNSSTIL